MNKGLRALMAGLISPERGESKKERRKSRRKDGKEQSQNNASRCSRWASLLSMTSRRGFIFSRKFKHLAAVVNVFSPHKPY